MDSSGRNRVARILVGDVIERLRKLPSESVHCCVTSPPYFGLRDYGTAQWDGGNSECDHKQDFQPRSERANPSGAAIGKGGAYHDKQSEGQLVFKGKCGLCGAIRIDQQIGLEETPELYIAKLVEVFRAVRRVLRDDGTLWLNLGDSYNGYPGNGGQPQSLDPKRNEKYIKRPSGYGLAVANLKSKDLVGIPWMAAFALRADGWWLRRDIIWAKKNCMPESVTDRPTTAHEYMFLLTKSEDYYYDAEAVKEPASWMRENNPDWQIQRVATNEQKHESNRNGKSGGFTEWQPENGRNLRSVWHLATEPYKEAHFATYPTKLVQPCIKAGTSQKGCCPKCGAPLERIIEPGYRAPVEEAKIQEMIAKGVPRQKANLYGNPTRDPKLYADNPDRTIDWRPTCTHFKTAEMVDQELEPARPVVLDPFCGSGTTGVVALSLGCDFIGTELNAEYAEMARKRIYNSAPLFNQVSIE